MLMATSYQERATQVTHTLKSRIRRRLAAVDIFELWME